MNDAEDASDVWFHFFDGNSAMLFLLCDAATVAFQLRVECVRDAGNIP